MTCQKNYRTGRIIVKISLLSAAAGTISHPFDTPPPLICAELSSVLTHLYFSINHVINTAIMFCILLGCFLTGKIAQLNRNAIFPIDMQCAFVPTSHTLLQYMASVNV